MQEKKNNPKGESIMNKNIDIVENYYQAMHNKDLAKMALYLHPKVHFLGPLAEIDGKEAVLEAVEKLFSIYNGITIRAKCASENQVMLAYDLNCPLPFGVLRVAALLNFEQDLISAIEIFFDARPFMQK